MPGLRRAQHPVLRAVRRAASRSTASSARCPRRRCARSSTSMCRAPTKLEAEDESRRGRGAARRGRHRRRAGQAAAGGGDRPGQRRRALRLRASCCSSRAAWRRREQAFDAGGRQGAARRAPRRARPLARRAASSAPTARSADALAAAIAANKRDFDARFELAQTHFAAQPLHRGDGRAARDRDARQGLERASWRARPTSRSSTLMSQAGRPSRRPTSRPRARSKSTGKAAAAPPPIRWSTSTGASSAWRCSDAMRSGAARSGRQPGQRLVEQRDEALLLLAVRACSALATLRGGVAPQLVIAQRLAHLRQPRQSASARSSVSHRLGQGLLGGRRPARAPSSAWPLCHSHQARSASRQATMRCQAVVERAVEVGCRTDPAPRPSGPARSAPARAASAPASRATRCRCRRRSGRSTRRPSAPASGHACVGVGRRRRRTAAPCRAWLARIQAWLCISADRCVSSPSAMAWRREASYHGCARALWPREVVGIAGHQRGPGARAVVLGRGRVERLAHQRHHARHVVVGERHVGQPGRGQWRAGVCQRAAVAAPACRPARCCSCAADADDAVVAVQALRPARASRARGCCAAARPAARSARRSPPCARSSWPWRASSAGALGAQALRLDRVGGRRDRGFERGQQARARR